jgi:hypothetical protein
MLGIEDDPLSVLRDYRLFSGRPRALEDDETVVQCLKSIEAALAAGGDGSRMLQEAGWRLTWSMPTVTERTRTRLAVAYSRLLDVNPEGRVSAEKGILAVLVRSPDESLVPLFEHMFDVVYARDPFSRVRKEFAVAGLAVLARYLESATAMEALLRAGDHPHPAVGSAVAKALEMMFRPGADGSAPRTRRGGTGCGEAPRPGVPDFVVDALTRMAVRHPEFLARFHARRAMKTLGASPPMDNAGGTYIFKVRLESDSSFSAWAEVGSEEDLNILLSVTLSAFGWDWDHLHAFYLSGSERDWSAAYPERDDNGREAGASVAIGELGLRKKVKFLCVYDFGDHNVFRFSCEDVVPPGLRSGKHGVVRMRGIPPGQYPAW